MLDQHWDAGNVLIFVTPSVRLHIHIDIIFVLVIYLYVKVLLSLNTMVRLLTSQESLKVCFNFTVGWIMFLYAVDSPLDLLSR